MKPTWRAQQGYKYYVYIGPGRIEYFEDLESAQKCARDHGAEVKEMF
ncbi:MAG: hypothetical protein PHE79_09630 [Eubacteriales bacterium]|nr:hypothetical protein [Eubacteriales bacterium]